MSSAVSESGRQSVIAKNAEPTAGTCTWCSGTPFYYDRTASGRLVFACQVHRHQLVALLRRCEADQ